MTDIYLIRDWELIRAVLPPEARSISEFVHAGDIARREYEHSQWEHYRHRLLVRGICGRLWWEGVSDRIGSIVSNPSEYGTSICRAFENACKHVVCVGEWSAYDLLTEIPYSVVRYSTAGPDWSWVDTSTCLSDDIRALCLRARAGYGLSKDETLRLHAHSRPTQDLCLVHQRACQLQLAVERAVAASTPL